MLIKRSNSWATKNSLPHSLPSASRMCRRFLHLPCVCIPQWCVVHSCREFVHLFLQLMLLRLLLELLVLRMLIPFLLGSD